MSRRLRPFNLVVRVLGILFVIPGLLQVPLPEADFHVVRHHHGKGEVCPQHDHLLRWHPQAGEGEAVAVLHWHWMPPQTLDPSALDGGVRPSPALHAHDIEPAQPDHGGSMLIVREDEGRNDPAATIAHQPSDALWSGFFAPAATNPTAFLRAPSDDFSPATPLSRLARWNC